MLTLPVSFPAVMYVSRSRLSVVGSPLDAPGVRRASSSLLGCRPACLQHNNETMYATAHDKGHNLQWHDAAHGQSNTGKFPVPRCHRRQSS